MNVRYTQFKALTLGFAVGMASLSPAWGDDIDIYFGAKPVVSTFQPNILMIIDTSGSMGDRVTYTDANGNTISKTRMEHVKTAAKNFIAKASGVNIGLMRFNVPGGPVLYPISPIDQKVNQLDPIIGTKNVITSNTNDGIEFDNLAGSVSLTDAALRFGDSVCSNITTKSFRVASTNDDSEEIKNTGIIVTGNTNLNSLNIPRDNSNQQVVGIRFSSFDLPADSTIISASLTLTASSSTGNDTGTMDITIYGETAADGTSDNFNDAKYGISSRIKTSDETKVDFTHTDDLITNQTLVIDGLGPIVSEIMKNPAWITSRNSSNSNAVTFIIQRREGSTFNETYDTRNFYSYNASTGPTGKSPLLTVTYAPASCSTSPSELGMRFENTNIPKDAKITKATLTFSPIDKNGNPSFTFTGQQGPAPAFTATNKNFSSRLRTAPSAAWTPATWAAGVPTAVDVDLKDVIQEIVEHDDWCGGDALALFATWDKANTGRLRATSFEGDPAKAPTLEIEYESDLPDTTCRRLSLNRQVNNSGDDAHEASNGTVTVQSSNSDGISLSLHSSGGAGIRFGDLRIPGTAADIESAYLEVTASEDNSNSNTLKIYAQKGSSSPAEFTTQNKNISSRSLTTAQGTITSSKWNKGTVYRSDDIAPVIKEVLNSLNANSWVAGTSSLVFVVKANSTSNNRRVYSYDSGSSNRIKAPRLIITFKDRSREGLGRTTRDELIDQIDKLEANGNTPIQDTLYESVLYYSGREVDYGAYRGNPTYGRNRISNPLALQADTYTVSTPTGCTSANYNTDTCKAEKLVGAGGKQPTYKSPMNDNQQCLMTSNVILLTDGEANSANSTTKIKSLIGNQMSQLPSKATSNNATNCTVGSGGNACVRELVEWAHEFDIVPNEDTNFPYPINGIQTLKFYTIGFNIDDPLLEDIARLGGGQYSTVQNEVQLETTFDKYFGDSLETTSTFVAPVAAVNAFNRLFSLNDLYFAIFQPEKNRSWAGNLKKYKIRDDATIIDVNANAATANGKFVASAKSFWSNGTDDADGASVTKGGANAMVPNHADRKIYTFTGSYSGTTLGSGSFSLTAASNNLHSSNNNLTAATFNNPTLVSSYTDLIDWIRGKDVKNNSSANRHVIGDPIHSSPVAITYGGTESDPDIMLYLTTNTGFLHAINATTGVEQWAFLPQELLGVQEEFYENADSTSQHLYGLDGAITTWVRDNNIDGKLDPAAGDHAYLYFGMRRGGRNYYAIDVTNTTANTSDVSPKLKWVIRGGESPYTEMGESWAQPLRTKINLNGTVRDVLIISGGYDSNKDVQATRQEDTVGRAIYIVDANNGSLIWSGGPAETGFTKQFTSMKYSIPAAPAGVDMDLDGLIDQFYVGDMGGQVWRFDIKNGVTSAANLVSGGVIADLAADSSITNNRRFYQSPDIAIERNGKTNEKFLAVVLGSGWRENPLDAGTQDRFYRIDQYDMRNPPSSYVKYTEADLYDASTNVIGTATDESQRGAALELLSEAKGWYINFPNSGEKTMSSPLVYEGNVYFNTFEPKPPITNTCEAQAGTNRAYAVALATAAGANNWNNADASVLSEILPSLSLIDRPSLIFLPNKTIITRDPLEPEDTNKAPGGKPQKTYWREN